MTHGPAQTSTSAEPRPSPTPTPLPAAILARVALAVAAGWADLPPNAIAAPGRAASRIARARHLAFYLAHVTFGLSQHEVARRFARHRASIAYGCGRIEEAREEGAFDRAVDLLEAEARRAADNVLRL
ncbi:chromosomal replication initiator DnaA [Aquabacter sp. CN5-332]|uniref:chromosomal replication initiator DnaA n=1 Tax=Aquabacter sp. CN5-332 TaxID=3156608 RepID=UPI0032B3A1BE